MIKILGDRFRILTIFYLMLSSFIFAKAFFDRFDWLSLLLGFYWWYIAGLIVFTIFKLSRIASFPLDLIEEFSKLGKWILASSSEFLMFEHQEVLFVSNFVEIVHVQLPHKWWKISVSKVNRQNHRLKLLDIRYCEVCPHLIPIN